MHASVLSVPVAAAICRIVRRNHSRSPHLRESVREIHSLRTGRFHGAPGRATNLPCPITPHHETVTRLFREKPATGQPPSRNSRLHESHFTNPPPRKTARPNHQQTRPVHQQPDQSISNPTKPSAARPVHQHDPAAKNCPPAKDLPADQRTVSRPKNCQPTKEPSAGQKTISRPKNGLPDQPVSSTTKRQPKNRQPKAKEPSTGQRTICRPSCPISGPCRR